MTGPQLAALASQPSDITAALEVVTGLDQTFVEGLARPGERGTAALAALASAVADSPLGPTAAEAVAAVGAAAIGPAALSALAAARAALLAAVHDALVAQLDAAWDRKRAPWHASVAPATPPDPPVAAAQAWLRELAIAGWRGADDLLPAGDGVVDALLGVPQDRRLVVLLDGLLAEARALSPLATAQLPARRWADLWTRAWLLTQRSTSDMTPEQAVSGRLFLLGVDIHEHATAVQVQVYGLLEPPHGQLRRVRASLTAVKVETIVGPAIWKLLAQHPRLLGALAEKRSLHLAQMPILPSGDLVWRDECATVGDPAAPFATARVQLPQAVAPPVDPLDRHPVHIAEPVFLEDYRYQDGHLHRSDQTLAVDLDQLPTAGPLTPQLVSGSSACIGLLRWDAGRWRLRPLAVITQVKRKPTEIHGGAWAQGPTDPKVAAAEKKTGDAVAVLAERAGRLLRK